MADFTFAIVVPLASPIQPVATSKHDTEYTLRPLISLELEAFWQFTMVRVAPSVNRSVEDYATPSSGACHPRCRASRRASVGTHRSVVQRTKHLCRCTIHPTVSATLLQSRAKLAGQVATGFVRQSPFSLSLVCRTRLYRD